MSRWVWIVELVENDAWYRNEPCVVAEAVIDATGHAEDHLVLAWRIPGAIGWTVPDFAAADGAAVEVTDPQPSVVDADTSVTQL